MADWNSPVLASAYADVLTDLKDRDFDAGSLFLNVPTNPVTGMIRYVRATNKFQEYDGAAWQDKVLSIAGGGTGASSASTARTSLGLGTMAIQDATGVTITGGSITGLGTLTINAGMTAGSGAVGIIDSNGKIPALSSTYLASLSGANLTNLNGTNISSGTINVARLGSGASATKFLRGDNTWQTVSALKTLQHVNATAIGATGNTDIVISPVSDITKCHITFMGILTSASGSDLTVTLTSPTNLRISCTSTYECVGTFYIVEYN